MGSEMCIRDRNLVAWKPYVHHAEDHVRTHYLEPSGVFTLGPVEQISLAYEAPSSVEECGLNNLGLLMPAEEDMAALRNAVPDREAMPHSATSRWPTLGYANQKPPHMTAEHTCKLQVYLGGKASNRSRGSELRRYEEAKERQKKSGVKWLSPGPTCRRGSRASSTEEPW